MTEQIGAKIKEARTAAGMSQKALAEAVDGVSADSISKAERGLKELTDEQLEAIAKATGSESLLGEVKEEASATPAEAEEAPATSAEAEEAPSAGEIDIMGLFNAAVPAVKEAVLSVLKGEAPQGKGLLDDVLPMLAGILNGKEGGNPLAGIIDFLASEEGKAFLESLKGVLENLTGVFGGGGKDGGEEQKGRKTSDSFLAFTFFYTVAIYVLIIGFFFLQGRTDIKLEE